jgi:hypothetical protein
MESTEYIFVQIGFILLSGICLYFLFFGLKKALNNSSYSEQAQKRIFYATIMVIVLWVILVSILSVNGIISDFSSFPPRLIFFLLPPLFLLIYIVFSGKIDKILQGVPQTWLLYFQSFRIVVEILLWRLYAINVIPVQMTFEGRNFDVFVGILGIVVAYGCSKGKLSNTFLMLYNIIGLMILANIVIIAVLSMPTPIRYFMNEPANLIVGDFPVIFLPTILVPLAYSFHFFSLRKIFIK